MHFGFVLFLSAIQQTPREGEATEMLAVVFLKGCVHTQEVKTLSRAWIHDSPAVTVSEEPNGTASSRPHLSHQLPLCSKYKVENPSPSPPLLHSSHPLHGQILLTGVLTPATWSKADLCGSSLIVTMLQRGPQSWALHSPSGCTPRPWLIPDRPPSPFSLCAYLTSLPPACGTSHEPAHSVPLPLGVQPAPCHFNKSV